MMKTFMLLGTFLCLAATSVPVKSQTVVGQIVDSCDKIPVPYAAITMSSGNLSAAKTTVSDADGCFRMVSDSNEHVVVSVSCMGYEPTTRTVSLSDTSDTIFIYVNPSAVTLDEVTVRTRSVIVKNDRRLITPTSEQLRTSTSAMDVLGKLHLPRITINPLTGAVGSSVGNGSVVLCVNGVRVTAAELSAVSPSDIVRIEYHDNPGARFSDASAVIDCITAHPISGGSMSGDSFSAIGNGYSGLHHLSVKANRGRSELGLNAASFQVQRKEWMREYDEQRTFPNGVVYRREEGLPVSCDVRKTRGNLSYTLQEKDRYLFSAQLGYSYDDTPASEEADRRNLLYLSTSGSPVSIYEHLSEQSHSPSLDLYFHRILTPGQSLTFDVVGTGIFTNNRRVYQERQNDVSMTDLYSNIRGRKYSVMFEGIYEKRFGTQLLSSGVRQLLAYTGNRYSGSDSFKSSLHQSETSLFAEYSRRIGRWGYMCNLTGKRVLYTQDNMTKEHYVVEPSASVSFRPADAWTVQYRADYRSVTPPLSALGDVEQRIDGGMVRRGNPDLSVFHRLSQRIATGYNSSVFNMELLVEYKHEFRPVMESVSFENGRFVRTYENQRSFRQLVFGSTLSLSLWNEHLSIALMPQVNRYISVGNNYCHTATMPRLDASLDFSYGHWLFACQLMNGSANSMYGEQKIEEQGMSQMTVGYKHSKWSVSIGVFNPFHSEYWMKTWDYSSMAPFKACAHTSANRYVLAKFSFRLSYGRQNGKVDRRTRYEDTDAGILSGSKH